MPTFWLPNFPNSFYFDFHKPPVRSITTLPWRTHDAQNLNLFKNDFFFQSTFYTRSHPLFLSNLIKYHTFNSLLLAYGCHIKISLRIFVPISGIADVYGLRVQLFTLYDNHTIFYRTVAVWSNTYGNCVEIVRQSRLFPCRHCNVS